MLTRNHDPHDWDIYIHATRVFNEKLKEYGFVVPTHNALDDN